MKVRTPPRVRLLHDCVRERIEETYRLTRAGVSLSGIAVRLRVTERSVERYRAILRAEAR